MCGYKDSEIREQYRTELNERKAKYELEKEKNIKEAKERIVKRKLEEGICLTYNDLDGLSKVDRIRLAKHVCNKEFR